MKFRKKLVKVFEKQGYRNNLEQGEICKIIQYLGNGCYEVYGLKSKVFERVYQDELMSNP